MRLVFDTTYAIIETTTLLVHLILANFSEDSNFITATAFQKPTNQLLTTPVNDSTRSMVPIGGIIEMRNMKLERRRRAFLLLSIEELGDPLSAWHRLKGHSETNLREMH